MQTSILSVLLALGLPGANSCSAQQQPLPRVGQTPPAATQGGEEKPAAAEEADADEPKEMDADEATDSDEAMAGIAEIQAEKSASDEARASAGCQAKCQGAGSCNTQPMPSIGQLFKSGEPLGARAGTLALGGEVLHYDENDPNVQKLTIRPGSTVVIKTKNGEQVVLRAENGQALGSISTSESTPLMAVGSLGYAGQAAPQSSDERVRELEKRVRELEAQLRERDGQAARAPQPFELRTSQAHADAHAKAELERAQAREMRERMVAQARDQAAMARKQADEIRRQAEIYRKQALDQQNLWRSDSQDAQGNGFYVWKAPKAPKAPKPKVAQKGPDVYVQAEPEIPGLPPVAAPDAPAAPAPGVAAPEAPEVYSTSPTPNAPRARGWKSMSAPQAGNAFGAERAQELQSMLNEMRRQMDEMREQMQALRQELERAPQRDMR